MTKLFSPAYGLVRAIFALAAGVLLIKFPGVAVTTAIKAIGILLIIVGGVSLFLSFRDHEEHTSIMSFNGFFDVIFGLVLLFFTGFFANLIMYLFGAILLVFGVGQITNFLSARKFVKVPTIVMAVPFLIAACGLTVILRPFKSIETLVVIFGIALMVYGLMEIVAALVSRKASRKAEEAQKAAEVAEEVAVDVEAVEVEPTDAGAARDSE
ncbi:MAG: DUF308 domain-containing protein [Bacteroidales bacterium]|nr:DUF308 domain-containing protein [Bacteroidales bacterium]